jgi:hypothetical protein
MMHLGASYSAIGIHQIVPRMSGQTQQQRGCTVTSARLGSARGGRAALHHTPEARADIERQTPHIEAGMCAAAIEAVIVMVMV